MDQGGQPQRFACSIALDDPHIVAHRHPATFTRLHPAVKAHHRLGAGRIAAEYGAGAGEIFRIQQGQPARQSEGLVGPARPDKPLQQARHHHLALAEIHAVGAVAVFLERHGYALACGAQLHLAARRVHHRFQGDKAHARLDPAHMQPDRRRFAVRRPEQRRVHDLVGLRGPGPLPACRQPVQRIAVKLGQGHARAALAGKLGSEPGVDRNDLAGLVQQEAGARQRVERVFKHVRAGHLLPCAIRPGKGESALCAHSNGRNIKQRLSSRLIQRLG